MQDLGCQGSGAKDDNLHEMCRYGAAELHAVAAFIGMHHIFQGIHRFILFSAISILFLSSRRQRRSGSDQIGYETVRPTG